MEIRIRNRQKKFRINQKMIKHLCENVLSAQGEPDNVELDITVVNDKRMSVFNRKFLNHSGTTDVISFPQRDENDRTTNILGDIVVCAERAKQQSKFFDTNFNQEFGLYIIHGILHLLGYDDQIESEKKIMEKQQLLWFNEFVKNNQSIFISTG